MATTTKDWLERARRQNGDARTDAFAQAEAAISHPTDWLPIAEAYLELGEVAEARRVLGMALQAALGEVWVARHAAEMYLRKLDDAIAARAALDGFRAMCARAERTRASTVVMLAEGYVQLFGDRDAARACLADARPRAVEARDLCDLAKAYNELGDRDMARELVDAAIAAADRDDEEQHLWWPIANALRQLEGNEHARRILDRGLGNTKTARGCVTLAHAWHSGAADDVGAESVLRCLAHARTFAVTADDWLQIGACHVEEANDPDGARAALEAALDTRPDVEDRRRIAHGFRHWLDDAARADAISPRGQRPAVLVQRFRELRGFDVDANALLDRLRTRISDEQLRSIARADYGCGFDECLASLLDIRETGLVPALRTFYPGEVLELVRWAEGETCDHLRRAFACTVLCIDELARPGRDNGFASTLAALIESCMVLGPADARALLGLLAAMIVSRPDDDDRYIPLSYYALLVTSAALDAADLRLVALLASVVAGEREHRGNGPDETSAWLRGSAISSQREALWLELAKRYVLPAARLQPGLAWIIPHIDPIRVTAS